MSLPGCAVKKGFGSCGEWDLGIKRWTGIWESNLTVVSCCQLNELVSCEGIYIYIYMYNRISTVNMASHIFLVSFYKREPTLRDDKVDMLTHTVLSRFLAHARIAEKPRFEKVWKNQFVPAFWRMRLYSDRGTGAPINAHMSLSIW